MIVHGVFSVVGRAANESLPEGHTEAVLSVVFSPDGNSVASCSYDCTIRFWNAHESSPVGDPIRGHSELINSVSYSPLGNIVASASDDKTIRLWDVNTHRQLGQPIKGNYSFASIALSPDTKLIASVHGWAGDFHPDQYTVQLWDVERRTAASKPFKGHTSYIESVQFSPDGSRLVSGSHEETLRVWDVERRTTIIGPLEGHTDLVHSIALSPDGSQVVSGSNDHTLRLWDTRSGEMIANPFEGHTNWVHSVDFSPRGTYVVSGGYDNTVRLWDIRTGRQLQCFEEHNSDVFSVAFSPCGQHVASGSDDRKVIIRSVSCDYPDSADNLRPQIVSSEMSTQQIFDCLTAAGCVDLSLHMDPKQETAMIVSGGGFGDIWMGQLHNGGKVAIKAWRTNALDNCDYKTLKRAARELYCWSRMDHPNIHRLQGVIMLRDQYLGMVSEWMGNGNLHEYLRKHPDADRFKLCVNIASGLEYMHSTNTVHGDLKAANVLVSSDGIARLSDFDFSVMLEMTSLVFSESSNSRSGSLRWMAPELLLEEVRTRTMQSDVYALGMTMLEIFTGDVPYPDRRTDIGVIRTVERGILPTRPTKLDGENQKDNMVWKLLVQCWAREPGDRPSSGQVFETLVSDDEVMLCVLI
ncbi:Vegetative incompatibility protein HET-E-1 [Podospora anserina] [Rhizoctonia solani]|uniref:Vegetative incompatibility protein HET-E-1 [Podospora anserina] n=1 Tax=Rhizoctonia solani TaxID=456999 RepID=A0A0K6FMM6_9AGAM|nr:Vegetative incompatibility protein HET-E-1 [Podospora anserina] [Rhizoctonia solani]